MDGKAGAGGVSNLLGPEVPVLVHMARLPPLQDPGEGDAPKEYAKSRYRCYPYVKEAWCEVVSMSAYGTPSLVVSTQRLLEFLSCFKVAASELPEPMEARERARVQQIQNHLSVTAEDLHPYRRIRIEGHQRIISSGGSIGGSRGRRWQVNEAKWTLLAVSGLWVGGCGSKRRKVKEGLMERKAAPARAKE
jgi:hypothetical protein